jgi:hypothetical protein
MRIRQVGVEDIVTYATLTPLAVVPVVTWSVFAYIAFKEIATARPLDYIIYAAAAVGVVAGAWRRDRYAGVLGVLAGIAGAYAISGYDPSSLFVKAADAVSTYATHQLKGLMLTIMTLAFVGTLIPGVGIVIAFILGFILGIIGGGITRIADMVHDIVGRNLHRLFSEGPPGVMALTAAPIAAVYFMIELMPFAFWIWATIMIAIGIVMGVAVIAALFGPLGWINIAAPVAFASALVLAHQMVRGVWAAYSSIATAMAYIIADVFGLASWGSLLAGAYSLLVSRRRGHVAYSYIAGAYTAATMSQWLPKVIAALFGG